ncbi:MAG: hypothetical protein WC627_01380 [Legionella sp.]
MYHRKTKKEETKDPIKEAAIQSNPCPICRVLGYVGCKCPKKGSGGGDSGSSSESEGEEASDQTLSLVPSKKELSELLITALINSRNWTTDEDLDYVYTFKDAYAAVSITLDLGNNSLEFRANENYKDKLGLENLFTAILDELEDLITELISPMPRPRPSPDGKKLSLNFNDKKMYDLFLQRLMLKNQLPMIKELPLDYQIAPKTEVVNELENDEDYRSLYIPRPKPPVLDDK